ncbi:Ribokinase-like protein [Aspergillus avenaceus]|uniref:Ribokinase-like protein n=1 Tax=Aspergillus avenaceus TaxID=36643 RepID=A0A5N6TYV7_ASPAV|nr:Ribokinase-like protein [Aspergillus avenaceus]
MTADRIAFVSLGLVVLDEIHYCNREALTDVLGGSGTYATLGARLFLPPPLSRSLGWMIQAGSDFPKAIEDRLTDWETTLFIEQQGGRLSTRGLLEYKDTTLGPKSFRYTTPILGVQDESLENTPLLGSKVYHYLETPQRLPGRLASLHSLRANSGITECPLIVWEPALLSCTPENLENCIAATSLVDVFSPNHLELLRLSGEQTDAVMNRGKVESLARKFLDTDVSVRKRIVIVRAGEHGCLVMASDTAPRWLPPFYRCRTGEMQHAKVVDPTGAGNAFLGAFAVGYTKTKDVVEAACYGAVGASFAVEQVGIPNRISRTEREVWSGDEPRKRLQQYQQSLRLLSAE